MPSKTTGHSNWCDKHECLFEAIEVREHPGKTVERCRKCHEEQKARFAELFGADGITFPGAEPHWRKPDAE